MLLIHLANATSYTTMVRQGVFQNKTCHTRFSTIHQIFMNSLKAFLAIVIICINNNERCIENILCCKYSLTGSPRFCTSFWQSSRNIVDILECIIHGYIMCCTDRFNALTDNLFKLFLDVLTDDKHHVIESSFDCIMN